MRLDVLVGKQLGELKGENSRGSDIGQLARKVFAECCIACHSSSSMDERCAVGTGEVGRQEVGRLLKESGLPTMGADGSRKTRLLAKQFSFDRDSRPGHCD